MQSNEEIIETNMITSNSPSMKKEILRKPTDTNPKAKSNKKVHFNNEHLVDVVIVNNWKKYNVLFDTEEDAPVCKCNLI